MRTVVAPHAVWNKGDMDSFDEETFASQLHQVKHVCDTIKVLESTGQALYRIIERQQQSVGAPCVEYRCNQAGSHPLRGT